MSKDLVIALIVILLLCAYGGTLAYAFHVAYGEDKKK